MNEELQNPLGAAETLRDRGRMESAQGLRAEARASYEKALVAFRDLKARVDVDEMTGLIAALDN